MSHCLYCGKTNIVSDVSHLSVCTFMCHMLYVDRCWLPHEPVDQGVSYKDIYDCTITELRLKHRDQQIRNGCEI